MSSASTDISEDQSRLVAHHPSPLAVGPVRQQKNDVPDYNKEGHFGIASNTKLWAAPGIITK